MRPFEFLEPANLDEACSLLNKYKDEAKLLAGGQSMVPLLRHRLISPKYVVNIKGLHGLEYIKHDSNGVRIGALTTHRALELSSVIRKHFPAITEMEEVLGSVQVRNWGTIGGDVCHADPASDPGPVLITLGARVKARSVRGQREMALEDFFVNYLETALEEDEILEEIYIPYLPPNSGSVYIKESLRFGDFPFASAAVVVTLDKNVIKDARIALGAVGNKSIRARKAESAILGKQVSQQLEQAGLAASEEADPQADVSGSAEYKRDVVRIITNSAVKQAIARAKAQNPEELNP